MNVTLNNQSSNNIVVFSDVENIVTFSETITGTTTQVLMAFSNNLATTVTGDGQYYITVFDETITNVMTYKNATNRRFWISTSPTNTAASVADALRACPSIAAEWDVTQDGYILYLTAKRIGNKLADYSYWNRTNIGGGYLSIAATRNGSSSSTLLDGKANLEVTNTTDNGSMVGRMVKQIYDDKTDFNITPMLNTEVEYGTVTKFNIHPSTVSTQGNLTEYSDIPVYMVNGYECNGSSPYLVNTTGRILWNKMHNGVNNVQYLYNPTVIYSVMTVSPNNQIVYYRLFDSTMTQIFQASRPFGGGTPEPRMIDMSYTFPTTAFTNAYYAQIQIGNGDSILFNVIKPLNATEYYQRIYWRNEYGGIQFFDFTAEKAEQFDVSTQTYNVNTFERYRSTDLHMATEKIYSNKTNKTYTLTTHLMEKDGKYSLDSLALAKNVWTELNGNTYHIIPTNVSVTENDQYNNIFTAQVSYRIV